MRQANAACRERSMRVMIAVSSVIGGEKFSSSSVGELSIGEDDFSVRYFVEGDECLLHVRRGVVTQKRRGNLTFTMTFAEGECTQCVLEEGGASFSYPIFTRVLGVSLTDSGCSVTLSYLQGEEGVLSQLAFTAAAIEKRGMR